MNLLLTGANIYSEKNKQDFSKMGYIIDFQQDEFEIVENPEKYDVVICNNLFINNNIEKFVSLKAIQLTSAGIDRVPIKVIRERNIKLYTAEDTYAIPIAEFAIMRLLEIIKNTYFFYEKQKQHCWQKNRKLYELSGKKIGILGFGNIGRAIAQRLKPFETEIIAINRNHVVSKYISKYMELEKMDSILPQLDVLILCIALTEQTKNIIGNNRLNIMKDDAIIINVSRGGIVDEKALFSKMNEGKFLGCAFDVFEKEPLSIENDIWMTQRLIISPHVSFVSEKNQERLFKIIYRNLSEIMTDKMYFGNLSER